MILFKKKILKNEHIEWGGGVGNINLCYQVERLKDLF